jgi:hypothetical protein
LHFDLGRGSFDSMAWVLGALGGMVLLLVGSILRKILRLDETAPHPRRACFYLGAEREAAYQPVAMEIETRSTILAVALNDAMEERDAGHLAIAWQLVLLAAREWDQLSQVLLGLLDALSEYMPMAGVVVPVHPIASHRFRSQTMVDYVRMHELLDQLVFRNKIRFQLHVRVLRRALETLGGEFRRSCRTGLDTEVLGIAVWNRLDSYFHDLDLVSKESLLALRAFLAALADESLPSFAHDLLQLVRHGVCQSARFAMEPPTNLPLNQP